jgi:4-diphosphocytidyl-2-C-methyl-D-erythritol kinase
MSPPGPAVTVRAPAKVNLQLTVGAPGADGYHPLVSVFQAVSLFDEVTARPGRSIRVTVSGQSGQSGHDLAQMPVDGDNLAARAARALAEEAGVPPDVHLHLDKAIPVAGGMAGGSADAAATLLACDTLWELGFERDALLAVAATLGSDVPFPLVGGTAVGLGRGDRLTPALAAGRFFWVFAMTDSGMSTATVYAELDRLRAGRDIAEPQVSDALMAALRAGDAVLLGRALTNDLQPAACSLRPQLRLTLEVGSDYGALGSVVSGSGPTCAFLARDEDHALDLAVALSAAGVCSTVKRGYGPVVGARVLDPHDHEISPGL